MKIISTITIVVVISLLLSFVFLLNYQYFDYKNHIYAFKPSNSPQTETEPPTSYNSTTYQFVRYWGSYGSGDGEFNLPVGISVSSSGNVYVADGGNSRIQVFAPSK